MNLLTFAGGMVILSAVLTWFVSEWFVLFTLFIGLNLLQYSVTGFCPAQKLFKLKECKP